MKAETSASQPIIDKAGKPQNLKKILGTVIPIFKKHKLRLTLGFSALLCVDFFQLIVPIILKHGVNTLEKGAATPKTLLFLAILIVLAGVGAAFFRFCWRYLIIGFSRILEHKLRQNLYGHILSLDRSFFKQKSTGDLMAHASNDLSAVQMTCGMGLVAAIDALVVSIASIGFMIHINSKLTLVALLPMPVLIIATRKLAGHLHHRFDKVQSQFSLLTEFARSAIVSIRLIKAYTLEKQQLSQFDQLGADYMKTNLQVAVIQGLLLPAATLVGNAGMLIILFYGGYLTIIHSISIGDFVAFITYLQMLIWPMMAVGWVTNISQRGLTSLRRIHLLLSAVSMINTPAHRQVLKKTAEKTASTGIADSLLFSCHDLNFYYPGTTNPALKNIAFKTDKKVIAITGRTGSGKSTLCKILTRIYPVDDNNLFFNGRDINSLEINFIRSQIAFVSQEPILFSNTLVANIRVGNQLADQNEVILAAKAASLHEDIISFPKQYETLIGEKGITLSGGQKQRLAIARALVSKRPLLLLDDVFSTVDVETEQKIITGIINYFQGSNIIFISNRQKLLTLANEVLFLENGAIHARGSHQELINKCEPYKSMINKQIVFHIGRQKDNSVPAEALREELDA